MGEWTVDVTEQDFEQAVVERSHTVPVVIDFWAPWCGPCRAIGPVLEQLADEQQGKFILAKINVDENPGLAQAFAIRSIPAVKAVRNGALAGEFLGAQPEPAIRNFIAQLLPSETDTLAQEAQRLEQAGKAQGAESLYRAALSKDANHPLALLGLARILVQRSEDADALMLLGRVPLTSPESTIAQQLTAQIKLKQSGASAGDEQQYRDRLAANPNDHDARFELAQVLAATGRYEDALTALLEIVKKDRKFRDDGARKAILEIFDVVGPRSELAEHYRSELAKVLFS
ncbi:MAG: tetratricopeptide repeat protein [Deltaproteobacteria bacterium]|nr:tetratricopeptide repeat protein [Deltaproteobacteria bacterium]